MLQYEVVHCLLGNLPADFEEEWSSIRKDLAVLQNNALKDALHESESGAGYKSRIHLSGLHEIPRQLRHQ